MKRILAIFILMIFTCNTVSAEIIVLKPNLMNQLKKQEWVDKERRVIEKKISNTEKLRIIRSTNKIATNTATPITKRITLKDKVQANKTATWALTPVIKINPTPVNITPWVANITWVDMHRVRTEWLSWYNDVRRDLGLGSYSYDGRLDATAHAWNIRFAEWKWQNHHRRSPSDSYYNFAKISEWFKNLGIEWKVLGWATTTENVWYGYYRCTQSDCTDELIASIRTTFEFFMSEKGKSYDAHYRSIVQPYFTKIGMDIITEPNENRYYLTVHYVTEFE